MCGTLYEQALSDDLVDLGLCIHKSCQYVKEQLES